jgi:ATP-dependent DNA helicase RecG
MYEERFLCFRLSEQIQISETAVQNNIAKLKSRGLLERIGADKGGYWEIIKK